jgi:hypothetical protein
MDGGDINSGIDDVLTNAYTRVDDLLRHCREADGARVATARISIAEGMGKRCDVTTSRNTGSHPLTVVYERQ